MLLVLLPLDLEDLQWAMARAEMGYSSRNGRDPRQGGYSPTASEPIAYSTSRGLTVYDSASFASLSALELEGILFILALEGMWALDLHI